MTDASESAASFVLEADKRFSQSILWQIQRNFYDQQGADAWSQYLIPYSITSSPHIAHAYAQVVFGFLRDCAAQVDTSQPMYLVEIGAGHGRFGYHFLEHFKQLLEKSVLRHLRFCYVMTDFAEKNIVFWQTRDQFKPYLENGQLDFAQYDATQNTPLKLIQSGITLTPGSIKNPMMVMANYVLDSLPQDLFSFEEGVLYEVQATVSSSQPEADLYDVGLMERIQVDYDRTPITTNAYADAGLGRLLDYYRQKMTNTVMLFPIGALQCVRYFETLSGGRMLFLSADKGEHREEDLDGQGVPNMTIHSGGFSLQVNFHALTQYVRHQNGVVFAPPFRYKSLNILALLLGVPIAIETRQAYQAFIIQHNPDDMYNVFLEYEQNDATTLQQTLMVIRLMGYDMHTFFRVFTRLYRQVNDISMAQADDVQSVMAHIWANYYHMDEKQSLPFFIAVMLCAIQRYQEALPFFDHSIRLYGRQPQTLYNLGMCYYHLHDYPQALACLQEIAHEVEAAQDTIDEIRRNQKS
jgi:tetratricopeptide (TPR) repeat protein